MSTFLDTNVLAYAYDDAEASKQQRARDVLAQVGADGVISTQVLIELHAVLTQKLGRSRADAERVLTAIPYPVTPTDATLVRRAAATATDHQLSIFDATILEAAAASRCSTLYSEDLADGAILRGVRVVNPFTG